MIFYRLFGFSRIEYTTRYNIKVKSGIIPPHVPEWQRKNQRKLLEKEQRQQTKKRKRQERSLK